MVMSIAYDNLRIEDIVIKNCKIEKRPNGNSIVTGICKVIPDDFDEDFTIEFTYTGKSMESSTKLLEYLKELGWKEYNKRSYRKPETLEEFCCRNQ